MESFKVKIEKENVQTFCHKLSKFNSEFDVHNRRIVIDGKSVLGMYSLDLSIPLEIQCVLSNNETLSDIKNALNEFIIKEKD